VTAPLDLTAPGARSRSTSVPSVSLVLSWSLIGSSFVAESGTRGANGPAPSGRGPLSWGAPARGGNQESRGPGRVAGSRRAPSQVRACPIQTRRRTETRRHLPNLRASSDALPLVL